ncbi:hypothetical protein GCM10010327_44260 [Streptomyces nitrosporeus]|nr:hypothetical protein GCM10010327_44260 [Streptomyces nitrosporeus]
MRSGGPSVIYGAILRRAPGRRGAGSGQGRRRTPAPGAGKRAAAHPYGGFGNGTSGPSRPGIPPGRLPERE